MDRMFIKLEMNRIRVAYFGANSGSWRNPICRCDHCLRNPASDMHECIQRGRVMFAREEIAQLIFQPELCGMLCQPCHTISGTIEVIQSIQEVNTILYGSSKIKEALEKIPAPYLIGCGYGRDL